MHSSVSIAQRLVMVVLVTFLVARLADTHLHMCLDGQEAPLTVHIADASVHNDAHHDEAQPHDDVDIDVTDAALLKKSLDGVDGLAIATTALIVPLPLTDVAWISSAHPEPILPHPSLLKPPLRGPPALSSLT